jgi:uncharacterized membrane protein
MDDLGVAEIARATASVATSQTAPAEPLAQRPQNAVTALVHLYRGELGRLTAYRSRLDTPTKAISSSALVSTFALGTEERTHVAFLFLMFINSFFLQLEARRFLSYDVSRQRVQLMERNFLPELLGQPVDGHWIDELLSMLRTPHPSVNYLGAIGWRLRRSYLWIYIAVLLTWLGKLHTSLSGDAHTDLIARAAIGSIPGWLVCAVVAVLYVALIGTAIGTRQHISQATAPRQVLVAQRA